MGSIGRIILPLNILWIYFIGNYLAHILPDPSTLTYFKFVYGQDANTSLIDVNLIDMIYLHKGTHIVKSGQNEYWDRGHYISRNELQKNAFYRDYEWAEVIRESTLCRHPSLYIEEGYSKGLKKGKVKVPYGCWFNRFRGSGIFVNVGKSLIAPSRKNLTLQFGIRDCENETSLNCRKINDNVYCAFALKLGYDSIQVDSFEEFGTYRRRPELVICSGKCATVSFTTSCPPGVELRTGLDATKPCTCDNKYSLLNCGNLSKKEILCNINKQKLNQNNKSCLLLGELKSLPISNINFNIHLIYNEKMQINSKINITITKSIINYILIRKEIIIDNTHSTMRYSMAQLHNKNKSFPIPIHNLYVNISNNNQSYIFHRLPSKNTNNTCKSDYLKFANQTSSFITISPLNIHHTYSSDIHLGNSYNDLLFSQIIDEIICLRRNQVKIIILIINGIPLINTIIHNNNGYKLLSKYVNAILIDDNRHNTTYKGVNDYSNSIVDNKLGTPLISFGHNVLVNFHWNNAGKLNIFNRVLN